MLVASKHSGILRTLVHERGGGINYQCFESQFNAMLVILDGRAERPCPSTYPSPEKSCHLVEGGRMWKKAVEDALGEEASNAAPTHLSTGENVRRLAISPSQSSNRDRGRQFRKRSMGGGEPPASLDRVWTVIR